MSEVFLQSCSEGITLLDELSGSQSEQSTRFEGKALPPAILASAKCLVFLNTWRGGIIAGVAHGSGFAIAKTPQGNWSSPCFVSLNQVELGAIIGIEKSSTLMAAMTRTGLEQLVDGKTQTFGTDITVQVWPFTSGGPDDQISASALSSDWVGTSVTKGALFEFSLGGGSLSVDDSKNKKMYGESVTTADILHGKVEKPQEMMPLYSKVNEIARHARD